MRCNKTDTPYLLLALLTSIFSHLDFIFTVVVLWKTTVFTELNPLFNLMLGHPALMVTVKLVLIPVFLFFMAHYHYRPLARFGLWICFIAYSLNFGKQIWYVFALLTGIL